MGRVVSIMQCGQVINYRGGNFLRAQRLSRNRMMRLPIVRESKIVAVFELSALLQDGSALAAILRETAVDKQGQWRVEEHNVACRGGVDQGANVRSFKGAAAE